MKLRYFVVILIPIVYANIDELIEIDWITENENNAPTLEIQFQNEILTIPLRRAPFCRLTITHKCDCYILRRVGNTSIWDMGSFVYCNGKVRGEFMNHTDNFEIVPSSNSTTKEHLVTKLGSPKNFTQQSYQTKQETENEKRDYHFYEPLPELEPLAREEIGYVDCFFAVDRDVFRHLPENGINFFLQILINEANLLYLQFNVLIIYRGWTHALREHIHPQGIKQFIDGDHRKYDPKGEYDSITLLTLVNIALGLAYVNSMCRARYGMYVLYLEKRDKISKRNQIAAFVHEMGHQFSLRHTDDNECAGKEPNNTVWIMREFGTVKEGPLRWSSCSWNKMWQNRPKRTCLRIQNNPYQSYCGNGLLEDGEECDCITEACKKCCDDKCRLTPESKCSDGPCCDVSNCMPKKGAECRVARDSCDIPEICDGLSGKCPGDYVVANGYACKESFGNGYCFSGRCGSHQDVCSWIFEEGYHPKNECYYENLEGGSEYGGCGPVFLEKRSPISKCKEENKLCGKIWCKFHGSRRYTQKFDQTSGILEPVSDSQGMCYSLLLKVGRDMTKDPTFVQDGSECGDGKMCVQQACVPLPPGCPENCPGEKIVNPHTGETFPGFSLDPNQEKRKPDENPIGSIPASYVGFYLLSIFFTISLVIATFYVHSGESDEIPSEETTKIVPQSEQNELLPNAQISRKSPETIPQIGQNCQPPETRIPGKSAVTNPHEEQDSESIKTQPLVDTAEEPPGNSQSVPDDESIEIEDEN